MYKIHYHLLKYKGNLLFKNSNSDSIYIRKRINKIIYLEGFPDNIFHKKL